MSIRDYKEMRKALMDVCKDYFDTLELKSLRISVEKVGFTTKVKIDERVEQ